MFKKTELQSYLDTITVKNRLILLIVMACLTLLFCSGAIFTWKMSDNLYKEKENQISYITESALNLIKYFRAKVDSGEISLDEAQERMKAAISSLNYDGDNYVWINDYNGIMLAHPKKEMIGTSFLDMKDQKGNRIFRDFISIAREKGEGTYKYYWSKPGHNDNESFPKLSYIRGINDWGWVIGTGVYIDDIQGQLFASAMAVASSSLIIVVLVIIIAYMTIGKSIIEPIQAITEISKKLATNDLTVKIPDDENQTEIGELNRSFKQFIDNLKQLLGEVSKTVEEVSAGSEEMNAAAEQTAQGAQQVAQSITQLAQGSNEQANDVTKSIENLNEMNAAIQKISEATQKTVELSLNNEKTADEGKNQAAEAVKKINLIKSTATEASETINGLGKLSSEIEQIVDLIKNIANQTNLLALNAAIEAARAGEHGKGFAVVAEEVKKLANQSAEATDNITEMIKEIQSTTESAVTSMDRAVNEVDSGVEIVENTGKSLVEILKSAQLTNSQIEEITVAIDQLVQNSENVVRMMDNVAAITEESAASAEEISSISEEQSASVEEINASSNSLAKIAENLQNQVQVFKI